MSYQNGGHLDDDPDLREGDPEANLAEGLPEELQLTDEEAEQVKEKEREKKKKKAMSFFSWSACGECIFLCLPCIQPMKCIKHITAAIVSGFFLVALMTTVFTYIFEDEWFTEKVVYVMWLGLLGALLVVNHLWGSLTGLGKIGRDLTEHVNVILRTFQAVQKDIRALYWANRRLKEEVKDLRERNKDLRVVRRRLDHRNLQAEREVRRVTEQHDMNSKMSDQMTEDRKKYADRTNEQTEFMRNMNSEVEQLSTVNVHHATTTERMARTVNQVQIESRNKAQAVDDLKILIQVMKETGAGPDELEQLVRIEQRAVIMIEEITILQEVGYMRQVFANALRASPEGFTEEQFNTLVSNLPGALQKAWEALANRRYRDYQLRIEGRMRTKRGPMDQDGMDKFLADVERKMFAQRRTRQKFTVARQRDVL